MSDRRRSLLARVALRADPGHAERLRARVAEAADAELARRRRAAASRAAGFPASAPSRLDAFSVLAGWSRVLAPAGAGAFVMAVLALRDGSGSRRAEGAARDADARYVAALLAVPSTLAVAVVTDEAPDPTALVAVEAPSPDGRP